MRVSNNIVPPSEVIGVPPAAPGQTVILDMDLDATEESEGG